MHGSRDHIVKFLVALAFTLALPAGAQAADIAVTTTADAVVADGSCSLREAVTAANADSVGTSGCVATGAPLGADRIRLATGTYELSGAAGDDANLSGDLDISGDTIIEAPPGVTGVVIDAKNLDRAVDVKNAPADVVDVKIQRLTIRNGSVAAGQDGGAIRMGDLDGTIAISEATIADSHAGGNGGALSFQDSTTFPARTANIVDSELRGNSAGGNGGAVSFEMTNAAAADANGLLVSSSTLSGNSAATTGGAIDASSRALVDVVQSTLSGNSAQQGGGAIALSGTSPVLDMRFATVAANSTSLAGGGGAIQVDGATATVKLQASIIAGNLAGLVPINCATIPAAVFNSTSQGYNLESANTCDLDATGDLVNTNPLLAPLADNGGPTRTHNIAATSPARNRVGCATVSAPVVDQRGFDRPAPSPGLCDAGALERGPDPDADGVLDGSDNCPDDANVEQANLDGDALGDACDPDRDGDGLANGADNCPNVANAGQANVDGDALGDACDATDDRPVTPPPPPPPAVAPPPPPPAAAVVDLAPALSALSARPARLRAAKTGSSIAAARAKRGTTVRFRLSETARVTFRLQRRGAGRRVGSSCRRATSRNRTRRRCDLTLAGSFSFAGKAGLNSLRFSGRLRGAALAPGRYWLRATPRDAGGRTGVSKRVAITVLRG
ncbi:MAG: hypothetical protein QOJ89_3468 [bacterium]